jgi:AraC-like DNA-binding protein
MRVLEKPDMSGIVKRAPAAPSLALFVRYLRAVPPNANTGRYVRLPDGEMELVVQITPSSAALNAIGTRVQALYKTISGGPHWVFSARFRAGGASPFFGTRVSALTDEIVPLETLWGERAALLSREMERVRDAETGCEVLQAALLASLQNGPRREPASAPKIRHAVRLLDEAQELPDMEELAARVQLSGRQFRRAFADIVGVPPKVYSRIVRFRRALRAAAGTNRPSWSSIAAAVGYWDQAHLISEFRAFAGTTPDALRVAQRGLAVGWTSPVAGRYENPRR